MFSNLSQCHRWEKFLLHSFINLVLFLWSLCTLSLLFYTSLDRTLCVSGTFPPKIWAFLLRTDIHSTVRCLNQHMLGQNISFSYVRLIYIRISPFLSLNLWENFWGEILCCFFFPYPKNLHRVDILVWIYFICTIFIYTTCFWAKVFYSLLYETRVSRFSFPRMIFLGSN